MPEHDKNNSGPFRYTINGQTVVTSDKHVAGIYNSIKRIIENEDDAATPWYFVISCLTYTLRDFAKERDVEDNGLLEDIRKRFAIALELYQMDEEDTTTVRELLAGCVADIERLDRQTRPLWLDSMTDDASKQPDDRGLRIVVEHRTQDMSIPGHYRDCVWVRLKDLWLGRAVDSDALMFISLVVVSLSREAVVLRWGRDEYTVRTGEKVTTKAFAIDNPYLSSDVVRMTFEYGRRADMDRQTV